MYVAVGRVRLLLPGNQSLKGKRHVLRGVLERIRARHLVAVAEVADQDKWQVAVLGLAAVGNEVAFVQSVLDAAVGAIGGVTDAEIVDVERGLVGPEALSLDSTGASFDLAALADRFDLEPTDIPGDWPAQAGRDDRRRRRRR
ncbi:MAG: DUF503 domain-containing protein [Deltaproteobacteria bacterium]|nr:DUF503 domain-containing protein [Deltaproteobacteria bacterium]